MRVGLDVDGVLRRWVEGAISTYKLDFPNDYVTPYEEWHDWELTNYFPDYKGNIKNYIFQSRAREIYVNSQVADGVHNFIQDLRSLGHKIIIVTAQKDKLLQDLTIEWLQKNEIYYDEIYFLMNKSEAPIDILLDDYIYNLDEVQSKNIYGIAFYQPWNHSWHGMTIYSFDEFIELLKSLEDI